jgi:Tol biopolymer transport system component
MSRCARTPSCAVRLLPLLVAFGVLGRPTAAVQFSDWSAPQNLGAVVNSSANEQHAALSPDGLSLYFSTDRSGGAGGFDLWVARRANPTAPWQSPVAIPALNSPASEFAPAFDPTGHWLFFGSERDGGCGGRDLWMSYRANRHDDLAWKPPIDLGCGLSWPGFDDGPTYFRDNRGVGTLFFISDRPGSVGGRDVWMATHRNGGAFGAPVNVAELNSAADDSRPVVSTDGLEFIFTSQRIGSIPSGATPSSDLWAATRSSTAVAWSAPVNLGSLNTSATEAAPALSADATTLVFNSNRAAGQGGLDLYVATRTKVN